MQNIVKIVGLAFEVVKAALPFPDFKDQASVREWLGKLTVAGPVGALILEFVPVNGPQVLTSEKVTADELAASVAKAGDALELDPVTINAIFQLILSLAKAFGWLK